MRQILFIKTSSLGDVVHHMPALTDAKRHLPQTRFAWVVEEGFAPLVRLHPLADEVIEVSTRRWRSHLLARRTWREIGRFRERLGVTTFDGIVDTQGLIRSAVIARLARGERHGYDASSIREPLASRFYDRTHAVPRSLHAIERNRILTAMALGYGHDESAVDYGLRAPAEARQRTAVLLHGTSRAAKEWDEAAWIELGRWLSQRGLEVLLPWGSETERARAERFACEIANARVPERLPLDDVAKMIASALLVVGVDPGVLHLAAAYAVPLVGIFRASDPALTGPVGSGPVATLGSARSAPGAGEVIAAAERVMG